MLGRLKEIAKSWVAGIFIGLLVLSFAVWGIGDIFLGTTNTDVAKVGSIPISSFDFERQFRSRVQQLSTQTDGVFDTLQARRLGLDQQVLTTMIQTTAFDVASSRLGLTISDEALLESIRNNEVFHGTFGGFSAETYRELLLQNGFTPQTYETSLRRDLARDQFLDVISFGAVASRRLAEAIFTYRSERRVIDYLVIPPEAAGQLTEPARSDLEQYYRNNSTRFTAPEYRSFTYILVEASDFLDQVEVSEENIRAQYDFDNSRFKLPERRTVQVVYFDSKEAVDQAQKDMSDGLSFDELIESRNLSFNEVTRENVSRSEMLDEPVAQTAFQLPLGQTSGAIEGVISWALVRVTNIFPGREQPYEEAREIIRDELAGELATTALFESSAEIEDALAGGATLEEIASTLGIRAVPVRLVSRVGLDVGGKRSAQLVEDDVKTETVLAEAFRSQVGFEGELRPTEQDGYFVLRVDDVKPPALKPFDEVTTDVREDYFKIKRREKLEQFAKSIAERAKGGPTFESLANEIGRAVLSTSPGIGRQDNDESLSTQLISDAFAAEVGAYVYGPASFGESWVVATPREAIKQSLSGNAAEIESLMEQLGQAIVQDLGDQFYEALKDELGVEVYQDVIDMTLGVVAE